MFYVSNAFSLSMVVENCQVRVINLTKEEAREYVANRSLNSVVGHADIAKLVSVELGATVPMNRATLLLHFGDEMLVAQYSGPRLPEGATALPEGATIRWIRVVVGYLDYI